MIIEKCVVGIMAANCYLLINETSKETVIIDPGAQFNIIKSKINSMDLKPVAILLTHGHFDHIMVAKELSDEFEIDIYVSEPEASVLSDASLNGSNLIRQNFTLEADILLEKNEVIRLADMDIKVIYTPGHTQGGVCYYIEDQEILFSGDTLFFESVGRTDFPTGDHRSLMHSIYRQLLILPESVKVYPGHGGETTIGHEKENNLFIREYRR